MDFSRQEYWSGLPCPPPGDLPDPGIKPASLMSLPWQEGSLRLAPPVKPSYSLISSQFFITPVPLQLIIPEIKLSLIKFLVSLS